MARGSSGPRGHAFAVLTGFAVAAGVSSAAADAPDAFWNAPWVQVRGASPELAGAINNGLRMANQTYFYGDRSTKMVATVKGDTVSLRIMDQSTGKVLASRSGLPFSGSGSAAAESVRKAALAWMEGLDCGPACSAAPGGGKTKTMVAETSKPKTAKAPKRTSPPRATVAEKRVADAPKLPKPGKMAETRVAKAEPVREVPKVVEVPKVESPKVEVLKVETPKVETPSIETPKIKTPAVETPTMAAPRIETPVAGTPKPPSSEVKTPTASTPKIETPTVSEIPAVTRAPRTTDTMPSAPRAAEAAPRVTTPTPTDPVIATTPAGAKAPTTDGAPVAAATPDGAPVSAPANRVTEPTKGSAAVAAAPTVDAAPRTGAGDRSPATPTTPSAPATAADETTGTPDRMAAVTEPVPGVRLSRPTGAPTDPADVNVESGAAAAGANDTRPDTGAPAAATTPGDGATIGDTSSDEGDARMAVVDPKNVPTAPAPGISIPTPRPGAAPGVSAPDSDAGVTSPAPAGTKPAVEAYTNRTAPAEDGGTAATDTGDPATDKPADKVETRVAAVDPAGEGPTLANARWIGFTPAVYKGTDTSGGAWISGPFDRKERTGWITDTATGATTRVKFVWRDAGGDGRTAILSQAAAKALGLGQGDVANVAVYLPR